MKKILGIIGGSGVYDLSEVDIIRYHQIDTPWGKPSDSIIECLYKEQSIFFIPRHGKNHTLSPSNINYRANIDAFKQLGVTDVLSISAVGSLNESLVPGSFIILDQFLDLTKKRQTTFFEDDIVVHVSMAYPTDKTLMDISRSVLKNLSINYHYGGSYVCIEGPQFSTYSESKIYQQWQCDVIGMTSMPEAKLCREASIRYVNIGMITDFDCWHPDFENVEVTNVIKMLEKNSINAKKVICEFISRYSQITLKNQLNSFTSLVTPVNKIKKETIKKLQNIMPELINNTK